MKSALIIGGDSTIGQALATSFTACDVMCFATSRRAGSSLKIDLSDSPEHWPELPSVDVVYLCAAITKLDVCEKDPDGTYHINVSQLEKLTERVQASGAHVVFLSSNQVFDGKHPYRKTTDTPCPINAYGKQKAAFESWLLARPNPAAVLRLTKVISAPLPILAQWEATLKNGENVAAFDDLIFAPTTLPEVVEALTRIGMQRSCGIFHLSGKDDVSYYTLACKLADALHISHSYIKPVSATSKGILPQFLPKYGTLESCLPKA